jgi:hypothetical protein
VVTLFADPASFERAFATIVTAIEKTRKAESDAR